MGAINIDAEQTKTLSPKLHRTRSLLVILDSLTEGKQLSMNMDAIEGIKKIRTGVYSISKDLRVPPSFFAQMETLSLKRTREIPKTLAKTSSASTVRTYSILLYTLATPTAQQKKRAQRLIRNSLSIRLRPGVLLFPHFRTKESHIFYNSIGEKFLDSKKLSTELTELGATTLRFSRLGPVSDFDAQQIQKMIKKVVSRELRTFESKLREFRTSVKNNEIPPQKIKQRYRLLSTHLRHMQSRYRAIYRVWNYDARKNLKRLYNMMSKTRLRLATIM